MARRRDAIASSGGLGSRQTLRRARGNGRARVGARAANVEGMDEIYERGILSSIGATLWGI